MGPKLPLKRTANTQIERMPRLICVFAGHKVRLFIMPCCGSNVTVGSNVNVETIHLANSPGAVTSGLSDLLKRRIPRGYNGWGVWTLGSVFNGDLMSYPRLYGPFSSKYYFLMVFFAKNYEANSCTKTKWQYYFFTYLHKQIATNR